ncbi:adenylate/guanylate cyclase domain-containing protein [Anaerolineales bacterium HSG24]|nr:adenylate/guanylate cyclase domain-containing protein [Anaerolineales bacterium HSG24]
MTIERPSGIISGDWNKTPLTVKNLIRDYEKKLKLANNKNLSTSSLTITNTTDEHLSVSAIEGERRQVTVIFADMSGFTALNDAAKSPAEVERVVALVNHLLQELSEAIYEFDGYIDKYIGDEIMAVFGAPKAHENDPELALRAALSMMERLKAFNSNPPFPLAKPLGMHIGINTGTVIAGMVGTDRKSSYTVMGDAVNVAARLEGVSVRGEVFVSEATYNLTKRHFVFKKRETMKVKGKADALRVYELKSAREHPVQGPDSQAPFTGREEELQTLKNIYKRLYEGRGGIVILSSDAGLGKSRLVQEFREQVTHGTGHTQPVWLTAREGTSRNNEQSDPLWLFGRGLSYRRSFANRLFVEILYSYLGIPGGSDDTLINMRLDAMGEYIFPTRKNDVIPYLATMLGLNLAPEIADNLPLNDPQVLQKRMLLAMGEWVEGLSSLHPVVMVFEDLHWADPSSVALIEYLFTLTLYIPVLLICATRLERDTTFWRVRNSSKTDYGDDVTELTLWPLTDQESRQLITRLLEIDSIPKDMEKLLLSRAEGNPLFLEEVLRSLTEQEIIQRKGHHWEITREVTAMDIPDTLQGVFTSRIDRLDDDVKQVLQVAAIIGRVFPRFMLAPMIRDETLLESALEKLKTSELIEDKMIDSKQGYMFKHVLTYETAYNSMLLGQRQALHKRIADYMARLYWQLGEQYAATVAEHYSKGEVWSRTFRYLVRAAEAAIQSFYNREAVEFYTSALDVAKKMDEKELDHSAFIQIYNGRAKILSRLGEPQKAIKDYEMMLAKAKELNNDSAELRALNGIGYLHANYDFSTATELFQAALKVARRIGDKRGIADTLNQLGSFYASMGDLSQAQEYYIEARGLCVDIKREVIRIEAEDGFAWVLLEQGETIACLKRYEEEIIKVRRRLGYRGGLIKSLSTMLRTQVILGHYRVADEIVAEVDSMYEKSGDFYLAPPLRYHQALSQIYQGEFEEAENNIRTGLEIANKQQQKGWQTLGMTWLSHYYLVLGLNEKCLDLAEKSYALALDLGSPLYILRAQSILASAYRRMNRNDEAVDKLENVYSVATKMGLKIEIIMILYQLVQAYIRVEMWDKARTVANELLTLAKYSHMPEYIIRAHWLQSLVDTHEKQYQTALNRLIHASPIAEKHDSRLAQYLVQIQKARLYQITKNEPASKDAAMYADKLQQKLLSAIPEKEGQQAFLNRTNAKFLQEFIALYANDEANIEGGA